MESNEFSKDEDESIYLTFKYLKRPFFLPLLARTVI